MSDKADILSRQKDKLSHDTAILMNWEGTVDHKYIII